MSSAADRRIARRYAGALFATAEAAHVSDKVAADLQLLRSAWGSSPALRGALASPLVAIENKRSAIAKVLAPHISAVTVRFLNLLVEKRRAAILPTVCDEFASKMDDARNIVRAHAQVAFPLDDLQRAALVEALERRTGKHVQLTVAIEEAVIGGALVTMQDKILDGTIRGELERLRLRLLEQV